MSNTWLKHPFRLLLYLEWVLLGIALLGAVSFLIPHPHPRHHVISHSLESNITGIVCIAILGLMGLRLPKNTRFLPQLYILGGFILSWLAIALINRGERIFPALLLIVVIRACLLFDWFSRVIIAGLAFASLITLQVMELSRVKLFGVPIGRPLPPVLRRLPPEEFRRVWFGWVFNSALLFAFVLAFVLLLVSAVLAENNSKKKLAAAHQRLREYALQIEDRATLEERNRIAREIHDSVGHYLTAQSIQLENTALYMTNDSTKANVHLAKARHLGREALSNIRTSVATLRHSSQPKISIAQLISDFKSHTAIKVADRLNLASPLPKEINITLFRIIQEALTNVTKHSQAEGVTVHLESIEQQIILFIEDDGVGFDPELNTTGFGLQSMSERISALDGKFIIRSQRDQGTQIKIIIPLSS
ncbi:MAG: sensor histidine kinase [Cyanobacteria bacterium J06623_7]